MIQNKKVVFTHFNCSNAFYFHNIQGHITIYFDKILSSDFSFIQYFKVYILNCNMRLRYT